MNHIHLRLGAVIFASTFFVACGQVGFSTNNNSQLKSLPSSSDAGATGSLTQNGDTTNGGDGVTDPVIQQCLQNGSYSINNQSVVYQNDATNTYSVVQMGANNYSEISQNGSANSAGVVQCGDNNVSHISQSGSGNSASVVQISGASGGGQACACEAAKYCQLVPNSSFCQ